jgi:hypothetical protein
LGAEAEDKRSRMLNEDDVVEAVAKHLETHGYRIHSRATTQQHGHDIVAKRDSTRVTIYLEAKGETSNRPAVRVTGSLSTRPNAGCTLGLRSTRRQRSSRRARTLRRLAQRLPFLTPRVIANA